MTDIQDEPIDVEGREVAEVEPSRRSALRFAVAAAGGALAAPFLFGTETAGATDGNAVLVGQATFGTQGSTNSTFVIIDTKFIVKDWDGPFELPNTFAQNGIIQGWGRPNQEGITGFCPGGSGWGIYGTSDAGVGVVGESGTGLDLAAFGTGRLHQNSNFTHTGSPPAYSPGSFELVRDNDGVMWASGNADTGGSWRRVNSFIPITPVRAWDSRNNSGNGPGGSFGPLAAGQPGPTFTLTLTAAPANIPTDAAAVACVFTIVNPSDTGYMTIWPAGATRPFTSSGNFTGGAITNFYPAVGLGQTGANKGKLNVDISIGGPAATAHLVLDITGYYM
jgi:hypothetical protein